MKQEEEDELEERRRIQTICSAIHNKVSSCSVCRSRLVFIVALLIMIRITT